ncbi:unnamed protein product [Durusdinium trenchii]|uniref:Uncharacterized protein n=2 Tax=Durusdinium trenchii TaxID=1381693 RepID=A0ABP0K495_9DINO
MFDFDELEEKEVGTDPANEAVLPEMPPGLKPDDPIPSFVADLEVQGSPRMVHEDPPEPGAEEAAEPTAEAPATPSANPSRPPGLPSPPREVARQDGRFLQIPRGRDVELHPLELQLARGAGKPAVKGLVVASNEQFSCLLDSTGTRVDVISNSSSMRCEVQAASRIRACALKPSDRKLLLVTQEGEVSLHRLEASGASVMFLLRFSEDVPQEVAWHPVNQKVFFTLHSGRVLLWNLQLLHFAMTAPQVGQDYKTGITITPQMVEASCGEAKVSDPKETLQHMAISPEGLLGAVSATSFWRWSLCEETPKPSVLGVDIMPLEELDGSQELRLLSANVVLFIGQREVSLCALPPPGLTQLTLLQRLSFPSPLRCDQQTGLFLAITTASEVDGEMDVLLHGTVNEPNEEEGFSIRCLAASRLVEDMPLEPEPVEHTLPLLGLPGPLDMGEVEAMPMLMPMPFEFPPGLPCRPPGLPSPPRSHQEVGLPDAPPGLVLDQPISDHQASQASQTSAKTETEKEAPPARTGQSGVESSDELSGDAKPKVAASTVQELTSFMEKRAHRASDAVVEEVLKVVGATGAPGAEGEPRRVMEECKILEQQVRHSEKQALKVLEAPKPRPRSPVSQDSVVEAVLGAATSPSFPSHLAEQLVHREAIEPLVSKEQLAQALRSDVFHGESKAAAERLRKSMKGECMPMRPAVESFMDEVSAQSLREMSRLLGEVRSEGASTLANACRSSVRATLKREVQAFESELKRTSKKPSAKEALLRRLEQKATVVHRELELVDQELRAAGEVLGRRRARGQ